MGPFQLPLAPPECSQQIDLSLVNYGVARSRAAQTILAVIDGTPFSTSPSPADLPPVTDEEHARLVLCYIPGWF